MAKKFITNKDGGRSLSELVRSLTKRSERLNFLVGYFFFSGFCEVYKDLVDKPLRILVGMDTDVDVNNCIVEYTTNMDGKNAPDSKIKIRKKYFETVRNGISRIDALDSAESEKSYHVFLEKLEDGTLEVRKTKDPNHAKMYLFYIPPEKSSTEQAEGKVIVGSSNFSIQGFKARNEVNVFLQDEGDYEEAEKIFNALWDDAVPILDKDTKDEFKTDVLEHTWLEAKPSPYLLYLKVLDEYFKLGENYIKTPSQITRDSSNKFFNVSYQIEAIREGLQKIKRHSGVIIADVVGLGKSVIASTIAANLDLPTVIVCPPHLESQWQDYAQNFGLRGYAVFTPGKIGNKISNRPSGEFE